MLPDLVDLRDVLRAIVAQAPAEGRFGEVQRELAGTGATAAFDTLARLFDWNAVQHSPMQNAFMNASVAFDAHLAARIDRWRAEFGPRIPAWLELAGEAEALTALATIAYENPGWAIPVVHDDDAPVVRASECGHPMIAAGVRVTNPVALDAPGSAVVISGSNMSGKTTYLRAIGLNALLAQAGGAVCATTLGMRRCRVRTSVRIEDDLAAHVSLFMAEVRRIRDVVVDAEMDGAAPVLFLFDEILHGTNAPDRREATQLVLRRLIAAGAAGVITTHDPTIGDVSMPAKVIHAHFTDSVSSGNAGVTMTFDYTMRPGPATTTNALRVFEALGLSG
jgi:DNA mismatch repair ATPase MutS